MTNYELAHCFARNRFTNKIVASFKTSIVRDECRLGRTETWLGEEAVTGNLLLPHDLNDLMDGSDSVIIYGRGTHTDAGPGGTNPFVGRVGATCSLVVRLFYAGQEMGPYYGSQILNQASMRTDNHDFVRQLAASLRMGPISDLTRPDRQGGEVDVLAGE